MTMLNIFYHEEKKNLYYKWFQRHKSCKQLDVGTFFQYVEDRQKITPEIFVDSTFPSVLLFCFLEDFFSPSFSGHS
jgi:hypothetical protein